MKENWKFTVGDYSLEASQRWPADCRTTSAITFRHQSKAEASWIVSNHGICCFAHAGTLASFGGRAGLQHGKHFGNGQLCDGRDELSMRQPKKGFVVLKWIRPWSRHWPHERHAAINKIKAQGAENAFVRIVYRWIDFAWNGCWQSMALKFTYGTAAMW